MLTVHPSIMLGSYLWDEERLPRDEFDARTAVIRDAIAANGWSGMLVYGDAREHAALAWFTNFIPRMRWAMALFPASGQPVLLASMSSRDIPAMKTMTWIGDVKSGWEWKWFEQWRATLSDGPIGTIGLAEATPLLWKQITGSLGAALPLVAADDVAATARTVQRPREISVIKEAAQIVKRARQAFQDEWARGSDIETCALVAERTARDNAAQDVRTLVSRDNGRTLQPFAPGLSTRTEKGLGYIAVKYLGYWADTYVQVGTEPLDRTVEAQLDALLAAVTAGRPLGEIAGAVPAAEIAAPHPVLSGHFGRRIGSSLNEGSEIRTGVSTPFATDTVYSLHAGLCDEDGGSVASALVLTDRDGRLSVLDRSAGGVA
ncbi:hypothetical protein PY365_02955 [Roseiarcaceae bacterium H3SJ34-1]|uniref:hypothetical protein n=1 Tax=Terripilifer ovatus TaxID=3032367 RepID=UPI003AB919E4|nr:hypothetical protein [Roseiarcaceae bacterium H3SJ34-1]